MEARIDAGEIIVGELLLDTEDVGGWRHIPRTFLDCQPFGIKRTESMIQKVAICFPKYLDVPLVVRVRIHLLAQCKNARNFHSEIFLNYFRRFP